ncbi:hypothetical protein NL676_009227 [Syzygium grande]|nr:hypothetical protein NL676_009227 [Syzygium grande]
MKPPCNHVFFFFLLFSSASLAQSDLDVLLKQETALAMPNSAAFRDWIVSLNVTSIGLFGHFPPEIGLLHDLVNLTLTADNLTKTLLPKLSNLTSLQFLNLSINVLSGPSQEESCG